MRSRPNAILIWNWINRDPFSKNLLKLNNPIINSNADKDVPINEKQSEKVKGLNVKHKLQKEASIETLSQPSENNKPKKRGRPVGWRKNPNPIDTVKPEASQSVPKKRGRPVGWRKNKKV